MPYITQLRRPQLDPIALVPLNVGELNFIITRLCLDYLVEQCTDYGVLNEVIGVLECAKLEFYRRAVAVYEDKKCETNGDLYP